MPRGGPCAAEGGCPCRREEAPVAAERRPLCREGALCAGRYSVLRELEEALCREEAPAPREGPLCW